MNDEPVDEFIDKTRDIEVTDDPESPLVPFPGSLKLTATQEQNLVDHAFRRLDTLEEELGRNATGRDDWYDSVDAETDSPERSFLGKRQLYKLVYANNVDWRPAVLGGIFEDSNLVVPLARRIARQMVARANNYFFGSDPYFSCYPVGSESDRELARDVERYSRFKFEQSGTTDEFRSAIENAFVKGEEVVKIVHKIDDDYSVGPVKVLVDGQGNMLVDTAGNPITAADKWIAGETGFVLKRDPAVPRPDNFETKVVEMQKRTVHYEGPEVAIVNERDILIPLDAPSVHDADCVVHLYDRPVMDLIDFYQRRDLLDSSDEERRKATAKVIDLIRSMSTAVSDESPGRPELDEGHIGEYTQPISQIAEFHLTYDANGDGFLEEIMLICDRKTMRPIFYDYQANVTPDARRPFEVIRINRIPGRWYGIGAMEMFESTQNIIDLLTNRMNYAQSGSGRVDLWRPYNTYEGEENPKLELNRGDTYTPKPHMKKEDILESVYLNDIKSSDLKELVEFFMQMAMNESGVQHANDAFVAGLDSQKLATGIRNIESAAQEMFGLYLTHLRPGIQSAIQRSVYYLLAYMREEEAFVYLEGQELITASVNPDRVRDLDMDVRMLLTRERGEQILMSNQQAIDLLDRFYAQPPALQETTKALYIELLGALQITSAESFIQVMDMETWQAMMALRGQRPAA